MNKKIKILHLEDSPFDAELVARELKKGQINFEILVVDNKEKFVKALKKFLPDIILSDHSLIAFDSHEALSLVKAAGITVPFILITATMSDEFAVRIMKEGADDYMIKDRLHRLPSAIITSIEKYRLAEEQQASRDRLAFHIENTPLGFIEWDDQLHVKSWSKRAEKIFGWTEKLVKKQKNALMQVYSEDVPLVRKIVDDLISGTVEKNTIKHRTITRSGKIIWCEWFNSILKDKDGEVSSVMSLVQDITEQKEADEKINKANRLYNFISQVNQNLLHVKDETTLFRNSCQIALEYGKFKIAWIGLFDEEQRKITFSGQSVIPDEALKRFTNIPLHVNGPQEYILQTEKYYVCNDIESDPGLESWKRLATEQNIRSCMILPVKKSGKIIGTFNLYASELNFFDKEEVELLAGVTGDISFALESFEKEKIHRATEELVVSNEKRFRGLIENSTDMITLSTLDGEMLYGSPSITKVFGYSMEEIPHTSAFNFIHPDDIPKFIENRNKVLLVPGKSYHSEIRLLHKNGNWIWCDATLTNMLYEPSINAMVANFRDISEKKTAEQQLEFDRNNLNALINNTTDLMWSVDKDARLITFNQPFSDVIRMVTGKEIAKGDSVFSVVISQDQSNRFKLLYARAFSGEAFTEIEYIVDPIESWSEISYYPIRKGNEVIGTACHSRDITERINSEKNLRRNEKRLKEAQAISHIGNWEINFATQKALWSEETYRIYGTSPGETSQTYEDWVAFIHPEDLEYVMRTNKDSEKTLSNTILDHRIILKDGTIKHIHSESKFEFDKNGKPIGLYGITQDVTEKRIAEEKIKQSEAHLAEAQRLAKMGSWNYEIKTDKLTWSEELYNVFSTDKKTFKETHGSFLHLIDEQDKALAFQTSRRTQKTGEPFNIKYHITTLAGEKRIIQEYGHAEKDSKGNIIRMFGTAQDLTEQILSQKTIEESEERYRQIVETAQEGIWLIDENNKTVFVNRRLCEMFGFSSKEMLGKTPYDLVDKEARVLLEKKMERRKNGISEDFEAPYIDKNGERIWANVSASPIIRDDGNYLGALAMYTDITDRKKAEIEKEKMTADLIQRNKDLEQFTYIVSHNLRAPLANIIGIADLMNTMEMNARDKKELTVGLYKSSAKLDDVVKDLNHVLQVRDTRDERKELVRFSKLIENIMVTIQNPLTEDPVKITTDFSEIEEFFTIKSYLYSIFYNLISNGFKYRRKQVNSTMKINSHLAKDKIELTFYDNGLGIDLDKKGDQVFGLYKRFHSDIEGKGMGLFIVKTQVETLGGKISLKSKVNEGTEFKIEFKR